jgi:hypothetical protein
MNYGVMEVMPILIEQSDRSIIDMTEECAQAQLNFSDRDGCLG